MLCYSFIIEKLNELSLIGVKVKVDFIKTVFLLLFGLFLCHNVKN